MPWYRVTINQPTEVSAASRSLPAQFHKIYLSNGEPKDAAMFSSRDIQNGYRCHYYFSPAAAVIAPSLMGLYNAVPCLPPRDVTFVVGDLRLADSALNRPENA
jgi:hypothetical protein